LLFFGAASVEIVTTEGVMFSATFSKACDSSSARRAPGTASCAMRVAGVRDTIQQRVVRVLSKAAGIIEAGDIRVRIVITLDLNFM
jgi:hypothetical protein